MAFVAGVCDLRGVLERADLLASLGPAVVHGFTNRNGGHSQGRYASLNMGGKWGDDPEAVRRNYAAVAEAGGYRPDTLVTVRQVHGNAVLRAADVGPESEADALWCAREDGPCVVAVLTADCVPIVIADRQGQAVAAVHSGWRGTVADIAGETVRTVADEGIEPARLVAAIGPCIELAAFEVGEEVAAQFDDAFVERERWPKPHVDLVAVVRSQLLAAGVSAVERVGTCSHANPDRYFSYRRDGAGIGQMMAFAGFAA